MFRGGDVVELDEHVSLGSSAYLCRFKTYEKRVEPLPHSFVDGWHMSLFGWIATDWEKKQLWRQYNKLPQGRRCKSLHRKEAAHSVTVADCRIQRGWRRAMRFISFHIISSFHLFQAFCCIAFSLPSGDPPGGNTRSISAISATALKPGTTTWPRVWFSSTSLHGNTWDNSSVLEICELKRFWKNSHIFATDVRDAVRSAYLRISQSAVFQIWEGSLMWDFSKLVSRALCDFEIKIDNIKIRSNTRCLRRGKEATHGDAGKNCQVHRGRMPLKTRSLQRVRAPRSSTGADSVCLADLKSKSI